jgi:hypothetical protein
MVQWGKSDAAANSVVWGPALLNKAPTRTNANTLYGNTTSGGFITGRTDATVFVDEDEAQAVGVNPGWALKTTFSGNRAGRIQYESLVTMSSGAADADAALVPNFLIQITSQPPAAKSVAAGANTTITFAVQTQPLGKTTTYQWQANSGSGFANISNGGLYAGVTSNTLQINSANSTANQVSYRVTVFGANSATVNSDATTITVTA